MNVLSIFISRKSMFQVVFKDKNKHLKTDIFNCGYSQGFSVLDVINEIEKITGKKLDYKLGPRRSGDIPISIADTKKFKEKFFLVKPFFV